ncbi:hypothetical protein AUI06_03545 [archaeon 13_2_20CM_2_52_21]|nr:MAG: hypothetical protein AUI06_03545 [archaeon 13_2_20CM_2_52_21]
MITVPRSTEPKKMTYSTFAEIAESKAIHGLVVPDCEPAQPTIDGASHGSMSLESEWQCCRHYEPKDKENKW